jgi:hypothetical protein
MQRALGHLHQVWPRSVSFDSLLQTAAAQSGDRPTAQPVDRLKSEADDLKSSLIRCYRQKRVELSTLPARFVVDLSEKPVASPLARAQALKGNTVTNLRHEAGQLNEFGREVIRLLDGNHDCPAIVEKLIHEVELGRITLKRDVPDVTGDPSGRSKTLREAAGDSLEDCLKKLARFALLVA